MQIEFCNINVTIVNKLLQSCYNVVTIWKAGIAK